MFIYLEKKRFIFCFFLNPICFLYKKWFIKKFKQTDPMVDYKLREIFHTHTKKNNVKLIIVYDWSTAKVTLKLTSFS